MKIKISFVKLNKFLSYLIVVLLSGLMLATLFFALPNTEKILPGNILGEDRFDLNTKDKDYWKTEYLLTFNMEDDIENNIEEENAETEEIEKEEEKEEEKEIDQKDIEKTKNIIYARLRKADIEEVQIVEQDDGLKVTVQTTKDETQVRSLIAQRTYMQLMVPKEDFEFDEDGDIFEMASLDNYEETEWTRDSFRNILVKQLLDTEGNRTYFAIFKTWPHTKGKFTEFLKENEGERIGFALDDFVTPIQVEEYSQELFAVGFGPDQDRALFYDIALNTGVIPLEYALMDAIEQEPDILSINHMQITLAIIASIIILTTYLYFREKHKQEEVLQFALGLALVFSTSFTILKIYQLPVDLFLLAIVAILTIIFVKMLYLRNNDTKSIVLLPLFLAFIMMFLGTGYVVVLGQYIIYLILANLIIQKVVEYYFRTFKIIFN